MQTIKSLTNFRNLVNVNRNMTNEQIQYCAESLVDSNEFYMLRPEDLDLCFRLTLSGQFGEFYDRLDQPMVFGFIRKYSVERDAAIARKRDSESDRSNIYQIFEASQMKKILTDVTDKLAIKEREPKAQEPKPERKRDAYQEFMSEWDKLPVVERDNVKHREYKGEYFFEVRDFMEFRIIELIESNV